MTKQEQDRADERRTKFLAALERLDLAVHNLVNGEIDDAFKGACDPADHEEIDARVKAANKEYKQALRLVTIYGSN